MNKYKCPKCGAEAFCVTAHVTQDWLINEFGAFLKSLDDCVEVTHAPDEDDIWECANCFYEAPGREFRVEKKEEK